jgi:hypothetical protein
MNSKAITSLAFSLIKCIHAEYVFVSYLPQAGFGYSQQKRLHFGKLDEKRKQNSCCHILI